MDNTDIERRHTPLREITNTPDRGSQPKPSIEDQQQYTQLMKQARKAAEEGHPRESLQFLIRASKIVKTEKVLKRITRIEEYLRENGSESESDEDSGMQHIGKGFYLHVDLYSKLYSYQREALMWFWRLHRKNKGGILGDDMGLGKTIQVISFLSGLFYLDQVKTVLIVLPVALIINWEKEFDKWSPGIFVESYHSSSKRERERALAKVQRRGGVLLTSYGLVLTNAELLSHRHGNPFTWDYVILDEGHKIKNPSKTTKAIHRIPATHRLILTGTPIQNNLKELWALFDFVTQGTLLGTLQTFNSEYANPITRAREKDATGGERCLGNQMAESLRELIAPYFLRRTKADVVKRREESSQNPQEEEEAEEEDRVPEFPTLTRKNDFVIWLSLTDAQIKIYQDFISLDQVKELLMTSRSPLVELTILKKLCDHPRLLPARACIQLGLETADNTWADEDDDDSDAARSKNRTSNPALQAMADEVLLTESCKLQFLVSLLVNLRREGHRTLVFSQSRKMLDIIEKVLKNQNFQAMRLDGTITKLDDREKRISSFQCNNELSVFLLTTQVGGVGLTLTGADRVVIFDPSWNPATDSQAVDRVYRIGQTRSVVIYRLITCGTVEEKIYRRQIFKDSLTKQTTGTSKNPYRYFSRQELRDLFILDNPRVSTTQQALEEMHAAQRKTDTQLDEHIAFLYSLDMFGLSDHDLMFSQEADTENTEDQEQAAEYVQHRVTRAKELVLAESDLSQKLRDQVLQDTEEPGSMQRHHRQYADRQTLLDHAAKLGREVNVPAFNKRRDDNERKNRSPSVSEEEQSGDEEQSEEEQEELNMSMANMTLDRDIAPPPQGQRTVNLLSDRPPSSNAVPSTSVICIEDSDDDDGNEAATDIVRRNESDLGVIEDSDSEVMTSPKVKSEVTSSETSEHFANEQEIHEESFASPLGDGKSDVKGEVKMQEHWNGPAQDLCLTMEEEASSRDQSTDSEKARLKRLATTPKESLEKKSRFSLTPQSETRSPGCLDNSPDAEGDSIQEIAPTPSPIIDLTDSDAVESEADMSKSFEEIEHRTIATSPLADSRQSLSTDSPPRPISTATDVGELEKNLDSDYYMESEEDEDFKKDYSNLFPENQKAPTSLKSPDPRPGSALEESFYVSPEIEQRSVALSPAVHYKSSPENSPENTSVRAATSEPTARGRDDCTEQSKTSNGSEITRGKVFHYNSENENIHNNWMSIFREDEVRERVINVTHKLSFDETTVAERTNDEDQTPEPRLEGTVEWTMEQSEDEKDPQEEKRMSQLEQSMTVMSTASGDELPGYGNHGNKEEEESEDDIAVPVSRRRRVIEESEEEADESVRDEMDGSLLQQSPDPDEEDRGHRDGEEGKDVAESDGGVDDAAVEEEQEVEEPEGEDVQSDLEEDVEDDGDEYEDSFIDDQEHSDEVSADSEEEYESSEEECEEAELNGKEGEDEEVTLSQEEIQRYQDLVGRGRLHEENGKIKKALSCYLTALDIDASDRTLQRRTYRLAQQFKQKAGLS
ncbi:DNA excision repair protein ERCC-6-like [Acanthaster planci]|uniref:DNA excision repair protein ERCC-6-like n=1 Tax=Acanthaster planci TaxID=133434 RepID=A0A8B7XZV2_ACAPL|nr:DNA excision repair protein ERCC-6-like [Acanthaster planci]